MIPLSWAKTISWVDWFSPWPEKKRKTATMARVKTIIIITCNHGFMDSSPRVKSKKISF